MRPSGDNGGYLKNFKKALVTCNYRTNSNLDQQSYKLKTRYQTMRAGFGLGGTNP